MKKKTHITIPQHDDIERLTTAVKGTQMGTALLLASALDLRRSEVCTLTWDDFDFKRKQVTISKALVLTPDRDWVVKYTKSTAGDRVLALPDALVDYLRSLPRTDKPLVTFNPDSFTKRFVRLRKKYGITCRLHDLRHYYASPMLALGVPDKYAIERMGHETDHMLRTVYQHIMAEKMQKVDRWMNERMTDLF